MSENLNEKDVGSNIVNTKSVLKVLIAIVFVVVGLYFFNFNLQLLKKDNWLNVFQNISGINQNWGTFGDYVGGILNPIIAAFAFYLIAKTYELQKTELKATKSLINDQVKLAALTALLNSNLTRIGMLESEKSLLLRGIELETNDKEILLESKTSGCPPNGDPPEFTNGVLMVTRGESYVKIKDRVVEINSDIKSLTEKNQKLEKKIKNFCKEAIE